MGITRQIGSLHRAARKFIFFIFLIGLLLIAVILWLLLPLDNAVKASVLIPVWIGLIPICSYHLWVNLSSLRIDEEPYECILLSSKQKVPEMCTWRASFNIRNPTPWEAKINSFKILDKGVSVNGVALGETNFDEIISKWGQGHVTLELDYGLEQDLNKAIVGLVFKVDYVIGSGIPRKDEYLRFFTLST